MGGTTEQRRVLRQRYLKLDPDYNSRALMWSRFRRTIEDYDRVLGEQDGHCATCFTTPKQNGKRLSWDHDHACCPRRQSCGRCIRGLLCISCNRLLGTLEAQEEQVEALLKYQRLWKAS